jgi:hypothetical protein
VWWLVDDGGLSILMPYIMAQTPFWAKHTSGNDVPANLFSVGEHEESSVADMARIGDLVKKFRFGYFASPRSVFTHGKGPSMETMQKYAELPSRNTWDKQWKPDVTKRWLRVSELIRENSRGASIVYVTMPFPREVVAARDWMSWLEMLSADMPPTVFVRGNGENVAVFWCYLSFYCAF